MRLQAPGAALLAAASSVSATPVARHSDALWAVVRICNLDSRVTGKPWPCLADDRGAGFTVIADPKRRTQLLVTPTRRVVGIESPELMLPDAPNLWWAAWSSLAWLDRRAARTVPREEVGLAVNSRPGRTQDQLHIHIDCLRRSVRRAVDADLPTLSDSWAEMPTRLVRGHEYRARWLAQEALPTTDPFSLLAADPAVGDRADWTLVMMAAKRPSGERGFVLLSHQADPASGDLAAGEELLDHGCSGLTTPATGK